MEKINSSISQIIFDWLLKDKTFTSLRKDKITFSIRLILNDFEKIILLGIIFAVFGKIVPYIICTIFVGILRIYCGGIHLKTFWSCFLFSLCYFAMIIVCSGQLIISGWQSYFIYILDFILTAVFAPLPTRERFLYSEKQKCRVKIYSIVIFLFHKYVRHYSKRIHFMDNGCTDNRNNRQAYLPASQGRSE